MKRREKNLGKKQQQQQHQKKKETAPSAPSPFNKMWAGRMAAFIIGVVLYMNCVVGSEFVFDDHVAIKNNPDVVGSTPLSGILTHDFWGGDITLKSSHKSYRPVTTLLFRYLYVYFGGSPEIYKFLNVLLHGCNSLLVHNIAESLFDNNIVVSLLGSILFATHPVHTEAVASVVGQADLLSSVFGLLAVVICCQPHLSVSHCIASSFLLMFSFFTKETGITIAIPMLLAVVLKHKNRSNKVIASAIITATVFVLIVVRGVVTGWNPVPKGFRKLDNPLPFIEVTGDRALTIIRVWVEYFRLLVCPLWLSCDYSFSAIPIIHSTPTAVSMTAICVVVLITLVVVVLVLLPSDSRKRFLFLMIFFAACFSPASHVFVYPGTLVAERLLYLPSVPFCLFVGWIASTNNILKLLTIVVSFVCSGLTMVRNNEWKTQVSLFESALQATPGSAKVQLNIGIARQQANRTEEALFHLSKAEEIFPEGCQHHYWMGRCQMDKLNYEEAIKKMHIAVECSELDHRKHALIALEAIFKNYAQRSPKSADAHTNLANIFQLQKKFDDAELLYKHALKLQKGHSAAAINYSRMLLAKERADEAIKIATIIITDSTHGKDAKEIIRAATKLKNDRS